MPLPAATLKDVFAELQEEQGISLRWLAIDGKAMNVTHEPQNTFETQAAQGARSQAKMSLSKCRMAYIVAFDQFNYPTYVLSAMCLIARV